MKVKPRPKTQLPTSKQLHGKGQNKSNIHLLRNRSHHSVNFTFIFSRLLLEFGRRPTSLLRIHPIKKNNLVNQIGPSIRVFSRIASYSTHSHLIVGKKKCCKIALKYANSMELHDYVFFPSNKCLEKQRPFHSPFANQISKTFSASSSQPKF
jgi:hypothetical protein